MVMLQGPDTVELVLGQHFFELRQLSYALGGGDRFVGNAGGIITNQGSQYCHHSEAAFHQLSAASLVGFNADYAFVS